MTGLACADVVTVCRMCNETENPVSLIRFPLEEKGLLLSDDNRIRRGGKSKVGIRHDRENRHAVIGPPAFFLLFLDLP